MWRMEVSDEEPTRKCPERQRYQNGVENILDMMNNYARKKITSLLAEWPALPYLYCFGRCPLCLEWQATATRSSGSIALRASGRQRQARPIGTMHFRGKNNGHGCNLAEPHKKLEILWWRFSGGAFRLTFCFGDSQGEFVTPHLPQ